jgi:hypothetical protein
MTRNDSRSTRQTSALRALEAAISPVGPSPGSYQLKPSRNRRTNTARVSPVTLPPPAYTPGQRDIDGARLVQRWEDGQNDSLPTYNESLDPEPVPGYGANADANDNNVEAGVAQQAPQQPRAVAQRQYGGYYSLALMIAALVGVFIYLTISQWSHQSG